MTTIIPRTDVGLSPVVRNFNRITRRPLLRDFIPLIICHHTGVNVRYATRDTGKAVRSIDRWKSGEYNYVIDQLGQIVEFAGEYQGAHCKGYNDRSYGVLFLNGTQEPVTQPQIEAFHWLVGVLRWTQRVQNVPWIIGHGEVAATGCPGHVRFVMPVLKQAGV